MARARRTPHAVRLRSDLVGPDSSCVRCAPPIPANFDFVADRSKVPRRASFQVGINPTGPDPEASQGLRDFANSRGEPLFLDVPAGGPSIIAVHLCGDADDDAVRVEVYDTGGGLEGSVSRASGNVDCDDPLNGLLTNAMEVPVAAGETCEIRLFNDPGSRLERFDVTLIASSARSWWRVRSAPRRSPTASHAIASAWWPGQKPT